jgi:hypothetical protein
MPPRDDDEDQDLFQGALGADLADRSARRRAVLLRRRLLQKKLAELLDLDPEREEAARQKDYEACTAAALKRMQRLRSDYLKQQKKAQPLIQRIQAMIARKDV